MKSLLPIAILCLSIVYNSHAQVIVNPGGAACLGRYTTSYPGTTQPFTYDWEYPGGTDPIDKTQGDPKVVAGFSKPVKTNDWWSSAIWDYYQGQYNRSFTGNVVAMPWTVRAISGGLQMQNKDANSIFCPSPNSYLANSATNQLSVSLSKGAGTPQAGTATNMAVPIGAGQGTKVKDYGDYHVTINWEDAVNTMGMDVTITKGSPFVFFDNITASTNVVIRTACGPMTTIYTSPSGNRLVQVCGTYFYGIFFSPGTTIMNEPAGGTMWQLNEGHAAGDNVNREFLRFTPPGAAGQRYVVLAAMPNNTSATFLEYERRAYAFITGTASSYTYNETTGDVTTSFVTSTSLKSNAPVAIAPLNEPIHAMFRHQFLNINPATPVNTALQYTSARGNMRVRYGNFSTIMKHYGMLQHLPWYGSYVGADQTALYNMINQKYLQANLIANTYDLYFYGKRLSEIAQLIPIARQVGHIAAFNRFRNDLRAMLADLLTVTAADVNAVAPATGRTFYYDDKWDMLVHYPASFWSADQSNDRHFHYGYVIEAAAMVARYDATFATQYGPMVEMLIKDVANWRRQAGGTGVDIFPYLRFFDVYEGHSWANGMATDDENYGNDQESTSEAINCWSSIALWGEVTGNNILRDLGVYLRTTEIAATEQYWFDVDNVVFPACFAPSQIGILRGNGGDFNTFWTTNRQCIYSINWLPFTGSSFYLGLSQPAGSSQADKVADMLSRQIAPATPGAIYYNSDHFPDLIISYISMYNPVNAKTLLNNLAANMNPVDPACCPFNNLGQAHPYRYFDGQFTAFTKHWVHTLDSLRNVQRIWSNNAKTHVFYNGCWYYVIDNESSSNINVTFSDGRVINNIPGDTVIVYRFCEEVTPVELLDLTAKYNESNVDVSWLTSAELNSHYFLIERSRDGVNFESIGKVSAAGNSKSIISYQFTDVEPGSTTVLYYRLKQYDLDGTFYYSNIVSVKNESSLMISVRPNPVSSNLEVFIDGHGREAFTIEVNDVSGRLVKTKFFDRADDLGAISIDFSDLPSGTYLLRLIGSDMVRYVKVIKE
ncbi:MAG: glycosyl hydrolase [Cytophagaceae bacterium]